MIRVSVCWRTGVSSVLAGVLVALSGGTLSSAGDLSGTVSDATVLGPELFSKDVSAFYLGVSGGYGSGGSDRFGLRTGAGTFPIGDLDLSGSYGGLRGGWRGVLPARGGRDYVYGFEFGYDFASLSDSVATQIGSTTVQGGSEISNVASLRFRNGLTNSRGSVLYFVSLGIVRGDIKTTSSISGGGSTQSFAQSDRRNGFSASIGAEHQLNENWSVTGEFEYVQFDSKVIDFGSGFSTKSTPGYRGIRIGLNYKF